MSKSILNISENIIAALAYVVLLVGGIVILIFEKDNKFVRFHAMQSVLLGVIYGILLAVLRLISRIFIIGFFADIALWALGWVSLAVVILMVYNALSKKVYKLPLIGDTAYNQVNG